MLAGGFFETSKYMSLQRLRSHDDDSDSVIASTPGSPDTLQLASSQNSSSLSSVPSSIPNNFSTIRLPRTRPHLSISKTQSLDGSTESVNFTDLAAKSAKMFLRVPESSAVKPHKEEKRPMNWVERCLYLLGLKPRNIEPRKAEPRVPKEGDRELRKGASVRRTTSIKSPRHLPGGDMRASGEEKRSRGRMNSYHRKSLGMA